MMPLLSLLLHTAGSKLSRTHRFQGMVWERVLTQITMQRSWVLTVRMATTLSMAVRVMTASLAGMPMTLFWVVQVRIRLLVARVPTQSTAAQGRIASMVVQVTIISLHHRGIPSRAVPGMMCLHLILRLPTLAQSPSQVAKLTKKVPLIPQITQMGALVTCWICAVWTMWWSHMTTTIPKQGPLHIRTMMARWYRSPLAKSNTS